MKQTTTIRVSKETKEMLDQIKIDLAARLRKSISTDEAIKALIESWRQTGHP